MDHANTWSVRRCRFSIVDLFQAGQPTKVPTNFLKLWEFWPTSIILLYYNGSMQAIPPKKGPNEYTYFCMASVSHSLVDLEGKMTFISGSATLQGNSLQRCGRSLEADHLCVFNVTSKLDAPKERKLQLRHFQ